MEIVVHHGLQRRRRHHCGFAGLRHPCSYSTVSIAAKNTNVAANAVHVHTDVRLGHGFE